MSSKHFFIKDFSSQKLVPPKKSQPSITTIGVITSGGDAPGMNPALRTIVRGALNRNCRVVAIQDGYLGLCRGNPEDFQEISWADVGGIIHIGGTFLGTARSDDFRTIEGRKNVVRNLLRNGINRLVIVGGDGSLTGARILAENWRDFSKEIIDQVKASDNQEDKAWFDLHWKGKEDELRWLHIVGLVGSIDNDMGNTSMTIGCDSALHRICAAIDTLSSTASSHQRDFVVEVMGRKCGWLALKAAVACGADYVFIPENPAPDDWPAQVLSNVTRGRQNKRSSITIVAEGAHDRNMNKITAADVKNVLDADGSECRTTILGHVQRGGAPSFYDRAHSMLLGHAAVIELLSGRAKAEPRMICVDGLFGTVARPISECLETCQSIVKCIAEKNFEEAMRLRGQEFVRSFRVMNMLLRSNVKEATHGKHNICMLHIGACAPGMNTAIRALVRLGIVKGYCCFAALDGIDGLQDENIKEMSWMDVNGWSPLGGAKLGTSRFDPKLMDLEKINTVLEKWSIDTLIMLGGWDGYVCMLHLRSHADKYPAIKRLNIMLVPCTISNNLPCTQFSIGSDTALNCIVEAVDKIKQSAIAHKRIFVIEVMGACCGYLCCMGAFATGAEKAYLHESSVTLSSLQEDMENVKASFENHKTMALSFTTEKSSKIFDTKFLTKLFRGISEDNYDVRMSILGHLQQGGPPTPMDRFLAVEMSYECMLRIESFVQNSQTGVFEAVSLVNGSVCYSTADEILAQMDYKHRRPIDQWWYPEIDSIAREYCGWKAHPEMYTSK